MCRYSSIYIIMKKFIGVLLFAASFALASCKDGPKKDLLEGPAVEVLGKNMYSSLILHYRSISDFYGGRALVEDTNGKCGLIDTQGNVLIECIYDRVLDLVDSYGICYVSLNGAWGIYNSDFKKVTKCLYDSLRLPNEGIVTLSINKNSIYGAIDVSDGSIVIPFEYEYLGAYSEDLFAAEKKIKGRSLYGYIDKSNSTVIPFIYADADDFSEGVAAVQKESKTIYTQYGPIPTRALGFINNKGETVIPFKFQSQMSSIEFHEGLCGIGITKDPNLFGETKKNSFIDKNGEIVISGMFDDAEDFENGVALIKKAGKYGYMNHNGEVIIPCVYDDCGYEKDKLCLKKDGVEYFFSYDGELIKE